MDEHERVYSVIRSDLPNQAPLAGEVPFFLGVNHINAIKAADDVVDIQLMVHVQIFCACQCASLGP